MLCQHDEGDYHYHNIRTCTHVEAARLRQWALEIRKQIKFDPYSGCFGCGVPQALCEAWVTNSNGQWSKVSNRHCQYNGLLIPVIMGLTFSY